MKIQGCFSNEHQYICSSICRDGESVVGDIFTLFPLLDVSKKHLTVGAIKKIPGRLILHPSATRSKFGNGSQVQMLLEMEKLRKSCYHGVIPRVGRQERLDLIQFFTLSYSILPYFLILFYTEF